MKIIKKKLVKFDNKPIPIKNPIVYPQSINPDIPKNFFTCLVIGQTGCGKTFSVCKTLKYSEQYPYRLSETGETVPNRVILISPTASCNPIFESLKDLKPEDIHTDYSDRLLVSILQDIQQVRDEAEEYQEKKKVWKKFLKVRSEAELTPKELMILQSFNFDIANLPVPAFPIAPVVNLVLDDLCGSDAFKSVGKSALNHLSVRNRHLGVNLYVLSQTMKGVPKTIRQQTRLVYLYRTNSKKIIEDLYEIVSAEFTYEQFINIYDNVTKDKKYSFLTIDNTGSDLILKENLESIIRFEM